MSSWESTCDRSNATVLRAGRAHAVNRMLRPAPHPFPVGSVEDGVPDSVADRHSYARSRGRSRGSCYARA
eukprot:1676399-Rhodomonas_salina.2